MADPHLGNALTFWQTHNERGELNVISGVRKVTHDIITLQLMRPGEDPYHPTMGSAPDLWEPLSAVNPQYWAYNSQKEIVKWIDLTYLQVYVPPQPDVDNALRVNVTFVPVFDPGVYNLTYGWHVYLGAIDRGDRTAFREDVALNGEPFLKFL